MDYPFLRPTEERKRGYALEPDESTAVEAAAVEVVPEEVVEEPKPRAPRTRRPTAAPKE